MNLRPENIPVWGFRTMLSVLVLCSVPRCSSENADSNSRGSPAKSISPYLVERLARVNCVEEAFVPDTVVLVPGNGQIIGMVSSVHEYREGAFLIACRGGDQAVYLFDRGGSFVRKFGRRGEGPGEFLQLVEAVLGPDGSVVAYDGALRRITVFDGNGECTSTFRVSVPSTGNQVRVIVDGLGRIVVHDPFDYPRAGHTAWVYSRKGKLLFTFGRVSPESEKVLSHAMLTSSAGLLVWAEGYYFETDPNSYKIRVYDRSGRLVREFGEPPCGWRSLARADFSRLPARGVPFSPSTKPLFDRFNREMDASTYVWNLGYASEGLLVQWIDYGRAITSCGSAVLMLYDLSGRLLRGNIRFCTKPPGGNIERYVVPGVGGGIYYVEYPEEPRGGVRVVTLLHAHSTM